MRKATHQKTKTHNTSLVLKTIYNREYISRADIARETHLTRPTVSNIVAKLIADQFVVENGQGPSAGGKRPTLLKIADDAHHLLCLDLGSREFRGALVNLRGQLSHLVHLPLDGRQNEEALQLLYAAVEQLLTQASAPILGIGIGTPGLINPLDGIVHQALNLGWSDLPLKRLLRERYQLPTFVGNDSHLAALAEYTFGALGEPSNLIVIKIGQGISAGIVLNGQIFYGDGFGAGEIGHIVVAEDGPLCNCGNRGCLEAIASTKATLARGQQLLQNPAADWEDLFRAVDDGHPQLTKMVEEIGSYLGVAMANLIGAFNIHHILIAGRMIRFGDRLLRAARQKAAQRVNPAMAADTHLDFSTLGNDIVLLGSSAMVLKHELGVV